MMAEVEEASIVTEKRLIKRGEQFASMVIRVWQPAGKPCGTVFCLHDFDGNSRDFDYLAGFLCSNGYKVVCPDIIGRGKSAFLNDPAEYSADLYLQCLTALNFYASKQNYYIASGWGATTLLLAWSMVSASVSKLVLIDPPLVGSSAVDQLRSQTQMAAELEFETKSEAEDYVLSTLSAGPNADQMAVEKLIENRILKTESGYRLAFDQATTGNFEKLRGHAYNMFPMVAQIEAPVLLVHCEKTELLSHASITNYLNSRSDRWAVSFTDGSGAWGASRDQALLVLGFLSTVEHVDEDRRRN